MPVHPFRHKRLHPPTAPAAVGVRDRKVDWTPTSMRLFRCDRCGHTLPFDVLNCPSCDAAIGYVTDQRTLRVLVPTGDPATYRIGDRGARVWRCLNSAWGCNWTVPARSTTPWCRSCRLTRGRPDETRPDAVAAWMVAEAAKRRLVHQLDELGLPVEARSAEVPDGLAFDLVHVPGEPGVTGHLDGVVTLDLTEADDRHRDDLRRALGEPFRTVIGHLRHEIGHYFWPRLVGQSDDLEEFRRLFGDERADYAAAIEDHYASPDTWDRDRYITGYASSHPVEDWAETFAHFLHILDALDTAAAHDLLPAERYEWTTTAAVAAPAFDEILDLWQQVSRGVNAIAESLGVRAVYPFEPDGLVVDKLAFVHQQVAAHTERARFYARR